MCLFKRAGREYNVSNSRGRFNIRLAAPHDEERMDAQQMLELALESFAGMYDIERGAQVLTRRVDALAQLRVLNSKYVLSPRHVLWEANAYEYALLITQRELTEPAVEDWVRFLTREAEPELVHPGAGCPPEGHMYSYLTLIFLCDEAQEGALRAVRRAKFTKNYRFSLRGWATLRTVAVAAGEEKAVSNAEGKELKVHLTALLHNGVQADKA